MSVMARYRLADLLRRPLAVAPMAGGPSTTELVIAAARAGALGFLAAGFQQRDAPAAGRGRRRR
jgi:nitronate monooxygenase